MSFSDWWHGLDEELPGQAPLDSPNIKNIKILGKALVNCILDVKKRELQVWLDSVISICASRGVFPTRSEADVDSSS